MNEILPFAATWIDSEGIVLGEIEREGQIPYDITYMWNFKKHNKLVNGTKSSRLADIENKLVDTT